MENILSSQRKYYIYEINHISHRKSRRGLNYIIYGRGETFSKKKINYSPLFSSFNIYPPIRKIHTYNIFVSATGKNGIKMHSKERMLCCTYMFNVVLKKKEIEMENTFYTLVGKYFNRKIFHTNLLKKKPDIHTLSPE